MLFSWIKGKKLKTSIHHPLVNFGNLVMPLKVLPQSVSHFRPNLLLFLLWFKQTRVNESLEDTQGPK